MVRQLRITVLTIFVLGPAGIVAGLLWYWLSPDVPYLVLRGEAVPLDPEEAGLIGFDGVFAMIAVVAGLLSGVIGYLAGGRRYDVALLAGLAAGGVVAALIAWRIGHQIDLGSFQQAVRSAPEGKRITGVADLRARGVLTLWPLFAVATYGLLEALEVRRRPAESAAGDERTLGSGQPDQVGGGELDLQAAPTGGHVDGREPRS